MDYLFLASLAYLHGVWILHNDIKGDNVVLEKSCEGEETKAVLIDFGKAHKFMKAKRYSTRKTRRYVHLAPELSNGGLQSTKSDIFSLGFTMKYISHKLEGPHTLREVCRSCLLQEESSKPAIDKVLEMLEEMKNMRTALTQLQLNQNQHF